MKISLAILILAMLGSNSPERAHRYGSEFDNLAFQP